MKNLATDIMIIEDMVKGLRIGRNKAYELVNSNDFPSFKLGRHIRVSRVRFNNWIISQEKAS